MAQATTKRHRPAGLRQSIESAIRRADDPADRDWLRRLLRGGGSRLSTADRRRLDAARGRRGNG